MLYPGILPPGAKKAVLHILYLCEYLPQKWSLSQNPVGEWQHLCLPFRAV